MRSIAIRVAGALIGLSIAFIGAHRIMHEASGGGDIATGRLALELGLFLLLAALALTVTSALPIRADLRRIHRLVEEHEHELTQRSRGLRFLRQVQSAFDMAEREEELYEIAGVALSEASDHPGEVLVADSSNAHLARVVTTSGHPAPGCGVTTPRSCPAVRNGQSLRFSNPNALASCPRLRERALDDGHVALCVPVNVLGTPSAVLHAVRDNTDVSSVDLAEEVAALEGVAVRFGARLGMMRAMSQSQLQADTDPLTGLLNRRAMENQAREMRTQHSMFGVAMADLDHFKDLNDTFGHDTGDRALRLFARVLQSAVRDADIVARHGGEEFVIILPEADVTSSAPVLHRLQQRLAEALTDAQLPTFTVSIGLVDSSYGSDLSELVNLADRALMQAKSDGRDRIVIGDPSFRLEPGSAGTSTERSDAPTRL
ncbi:MAG: GGDEF domain-containing protein [Ilumatobacteraceae bacterium]|nr:GGDEF domain-containing protein [Ilumatobacteraceae bacterium]